MREGLLAELHYALGEAVLNSQCAQEMETREGIKEEYDQDIELFESLRAELMEEMFGDKLQKGNNKG